jgi:hypothetical protein
LGQRSTKAVLEDIAVHLEFISPSSLANDPARQAPIHKKSKSSWWGKIMSKKDTEYPKKELKALDLKPDLLSEDDL